MSAPAMEIELLEPRPGIDGMIHGPPGEPVLVTCQMWNRSKAPLTIGNVDLGPGSCNCQVVQPPPAELSPDESAVVHLRLRFPIAGRADIPVTIQDPDKQPLASVVAILHADRRPPFFTVLQAHVDVRLVKGEQHGFQVSLVTVERPADRPFVTGVEATGPGLCRSRKL
jgi:hypothetical protein